MSSPDALLAVHPWRRHPTPSPEAAYWKLAATTVAFAQDPAATFGLLLDQYRATRPDATDAEHAAAVARLTTMCGLRG